MTARCTGPHWIKDRFSLARGVRLLRKRKVGSSGSLLITNRYSFRATANLPIVPRLRLGRTASRRQEPQDR